MKSSWNVPSGNLPVPQTVTKRDQSLPLNPTNIIKSALLTLFLEFTMPKSSIQSHLSSMKVKSFPAQHLSLIVSLKNIQIYVTLQVSSSSKFSSSPPSQLDLGRGRRGGGGCHRIGHISCERYILSYEYVVTFRLRAWLYAYMRTKSETKTCAAIVPNNFLTAVSAIETVSGLAQTLFSSRQAVKACL